MWNGSEGDESMISHFRAAVFLSKNYDRGSNSGRSWSFTLALELSYLKRTSVLRGISITCLIIRSDEVRGEEWEEKS
jgi:hypothetical protein